MNSSAESLRAKAGLRQKLLKRRQALDPADVTTRSRQLVDRLIAEIDWSQCKMLHCFLPLANDNEPDLRLLIEYALDHGVAVYTSDPSNSTGRHVKKLEDPDRQAQLHQFELGDAVEFNLIIVPMLGFDPNTNHRLGFGGGFYDRFLKVQPRAQKIGVCFKEFAVQLTPELHDIPLNIILNA